jgi:hypothetical protein
MIGPGVASDWPQELQLAMAYLENKSGLVGLEVMKPPTWCAYLLITGIHCIPARPGNKSTLRAPAHFVSLRVGNL